MIKTKITVLVDNISLLLIEKEKIYVKSRILNSEKLQSLDEKTFNKIECLLPENITLFRLSNFLESRCISKHDKGLDYWLKKYDIHSIGDIPSTFSEKEIISSELEQEALRLHKQWGDEADFWRYEYNYQSSTARAIHLKARSNLSGQAANRSGITEHKRWNAYMRSLGYTYSGSGDPSSRNDLAKLHNYLIPYDQLSASEKLKDEDP